MDRPLSRRNFLWSAAAVTASGSLLLPSSRQVLAAAGAPTPAPAALGDRPVQKSVVSVVSGEDRRKNVCDSLVTIEDQILPVLKTKKSVVIKPNIVTARALAATNVDALHGILDFLGPRFKGPVVIAESSAGDSMAGFDTLRYKEVISEHKPLDVSLVDLNEEGHYQTHYILDGDLHMVPVRLAARLLDPDAFIICSAMLKTHNAATKGRTLVRRTRYTIRPVAAAIMAVSKNHGGRARRNHIPSGANDSAK